MPQSNRISRLNGIKMLYVAVTIINVTISIAYNKLHKSLKKQTQTYLKLSLSNYFQTKRDTVEHIYNISLMS